LIGYLAQSRIDFHPLWVVVYVAVSIGIGGAYVLVVKPLVRLTRGTPSNAAVPSTDQQNLFPHAKNAPLVEAFFRRPLQTIILAPGETGLFFVPIAIIGVTWWSALIAALLFGLAHHRTYSVEQCSVKAFTAFLNCYFILPYGVIHMAIGHFIVDAVGISVFWLTTSRRDRRSANSTMGTDARESSARGSS